MRLLLFQGKNFKLVLVSVVIILFVVVGYMLVQTPIINFYSRKDCISRYRYNFLFFCFKEEGFNFERGSNKALSQIISYSIANTNFSSFDIKMIDVVSSSENQTLYQLFYSGEEQAAESFSVLEIDRRHFLVQVNISPVYLNKQNPNSRSSYRFSGLFLQSLAHIIQGENIGVVNIFNDKESVGFITEYMKDISQLPEKDLPFILD